MTVKQRNLRRVERKMEVKREHVRHATHFAVFC